MVFRTGRAAVAFHDAGHRNQQEIQESIRADHGTDQLVPADWAETRQEERADGGQQRPEVGRGSAEGNGITEKCTHRFPNRFPGAGESLQDIGAVRESVSVQHNEGGDTIRTVRRTVRHAGIQTEIT